MTRRTAGQLARMTALVVGALVFLFPFWYMLIGSLQRDPRTDPAGALPDPANLTFHNYSQINEVVPLARALVNSGIFTAAVVCCTAIVGALSGYALAQLHWRGRGTLFAAVLIVQVVPFELLMIPLYVLIVRSYGLSDSYLGMMLPFAVNPTAVLIFRQFFLGLPRDLFEAARMDGASESLVLRRVALPLVRPAMLTVVLVSFIGPWNEFLWPFLITKRTDMQPLAVALANYISNVAGRAANPYGAILAGACVLAAPAVGLFLAFQRRFISTDLGSATKG